MKKTIRLVLSFFLTLGALPAAYSAKAPVDLNTAVTNPSLVKAMERVVREDSDAARDALVVELQRANYLAAIMKNSLKTSRPGKKGEAKIEKGSMLQVLSAQKDGKTYLLLFTDWDAIKAYTSAEVSGWVLPAKDAWDFILRGKTYEGALLNPAHNALPLDRSVVEFLKNNEANQPNP